MSVANRKLTGKLQFRNLEGCERRVTSNRPSLQLKAPEIDAVAANGSEVRITLVSGQRRQHPGAQYLGFGWGVRTGVGQWAAFLPAPPQVMRIRNSIRQGNCPNGAAALAVSHRYLYTARRRLYSSTRHGHCFGFYPLQFRLTLRMTPPVAIKPTGCLSCRDFARCQLSVFRINPQPMWK